jgi:hypothetical protein
LIGGKLRLRIEFADRIDRVAEKFYAYRSVCVRRPNIDDTAAHPRRQVHDNRPGGEVDVQYVRSKDGIDTVLFQFGTPYSQYQVVDNYWTDWSGAGRYAHTPPDTDTGRWLFAEGPVSAPNHDGLVTITNNAYDTVCILDLRDVRDPQRSGCEASLMASQSNGNSTEGQGMPGSNVDKCTTCGPGGKTPMPRHNLE